MTTTTDKPVKLELWAVPVTLYGTGYVGVLAPEGTAPDDLHTYGGIGWGTGIDGGTRTFTTPSSVADHLQTLLRNLGEGKVGR